MPTLSKDDIARIAERVIGGAQAVAVNDASGHDVADYVAARLPAEFADLFSALDPGFNRGQFLKDCGWQES